MSGFLKQRVLALCLILVFGIEQAAFCLPQDWTVESGDVSFNVSEDNSMLTINASNNAIINFGSFNIGQGEMVQFIQPGMDSSVLSRVTGGGSSDIFGSLFSNGQLVLINQNGITFHDTANVQVGSLIASTLDIQSSLYLSNQFTFEKLNNSNPASIFNEGTITARDGGSIALLSDQQILNSGSITANLGSIALGVGEKQTISFDNNGLINLIIESPITTSGVGLGITNASTGLLQANGGRINLSVKTLNDVLDTLINNEGIIEATQAVERDGEIVFEANGIVETRGTISTTNLFINDKTTLNAHDTRFNIEGDWNNHGAFNGQESTVEFLGAKNIHYIYGDSDFYNLQAYGSNRAIFFESQKLQRVYGKLDLVGEFANLLKIHSTVLGSRYFLDVLGDSHLDFVDVQDSAQLGGDEILITRSHSDGNISGWNADPEWTNGTGDGFWNTGLNWDSGVVPGGGNTVTFTGNTGLYPQSDGNMTLNANPTIANLTIGAGYAGIFDLNGNTITITNSFTQNGGTVAGTGGGTIEVQAGGASVNGGAAGTWTGGRLFMNVGGSVTWTPGSVSWYDVQANLPGGGCCDNLTINGGDALVTNSFTLNGAELASGNINLQGNLFIANGAYGGGSITLMGTGLQEISQSAGSSPNVIINKASGTARIATGSIDYTFQSGRTFTMTSTGTGVFDLNGKTMIVPNFTQTAGTVTDSVGGGILRVTGAMTGVAGSWTAGSMDLNNAGNFTWTPGSTSYYDVSVHLPGGGCCDNLTVSGGSANVTHDLTLNSVEISSGNINVQRNLIMTANVAGGAGSVTLNGTGAQTISQGAGGSAPNITINKASGVASIDSGSSDISLQSGRTFTITDTGSGNFDLNNKLLITPHFVQTAGTVAGTGGGTLRVTQPGGTSGVAGTWTGGTLHLNQGGNFDWTPGNVNYYNVNVDFYGGGCCDTFRLLGGSQTAVITNNLTLTGGEYMAGIFDVRGNITTAAGWAGGIAWFTLSGSNNQTIDFSLGNDPDGNFTINKSAGTVSLLSDWVLDTAGQDLTITSGALDLDGHNLTVNDQFTIGDNGILRLLGSETVSAIDANTGTIVFDAPGGGALPGIPGGAGSYYGVGFAGAGSWTLGADLNISGNFLLQDTATVNFQNHNLAMGGSFQKSAGSTLSNLGLTTLNATGLAAAKTITTNGYNFSNMTVNGANRQWDMQDQLHVTGDLNIIAGTLNLAGSNLVVDSTFTNNGTLAMIGAETVSSIDAGNVSVSYTGTGTYNSLSLGNSYYNLTFNGAGTWNLNSDLTVTNDLTLTQGTLDLNSRNLAVTNNFVVGASGNLRLQGSETVSAIDTNNGTVTYYGAGNYTAASGGLVTGDTYNNLVFNGPGTWELDNNLTVNNNLTLTQGTVDINAHNLAVTTNFSIGATGNLRLQGAETVSTINTNNGTVTYDGAGNYTAAAGGLVAGDTYNNLVFNGSGTWALDNNLTVNNSLTLTQGTLDLEGRNLSVTGTFSNDAALRLQNTETITFTSGFDTNSGTVIYDGAGTYGALRAAMGNDYHNLTLTGAGTYNLGGVINVEGDFSNTATLNHSGTLILDNASVTSNINGSSTFNNLTINAGKTVRFAAATTTSVTGTFSAQGVALNQITLSSQTPGQTWNINPNAPGALLDYLNIQDSINTSGVLLNPANSVNLGNTTLWFPVPVVADQNTASVSQGVIAIQDSINITQPSNTAPVVSDNTQQPAASPVSEPQPEEQPVSSESKVESDPSAEPAVVEASTETKKEEKKDEEQASESEEPAQETKQTDSKENKPSAAAQSVEVPQEHLQEPMTKSDPFDFDKTLQFGKKGEDYISANTSEVDVNEGSVTVNGHLVYDGEKAYVKNFRDDQRNTVSTSTALHMRGVYIVTSEGMDVLRAKVHQPLNTHNTASPLVDIAESNQKNEVYLFSKGKQLSVMNTNSFNVKDYPVLKEGSSDALISPDDKQAFVTNAFTDEVTVLNLKDHSKAQTFESGAMPLQATISNDGRNLFVSNTLDGTVSKIDSKTGKMLNTFQAGTLPYGLYVSKNGETLFASDYKEGVVRVLDTTSGIEKAKISVGDGPYLLEADAKENILLVSNRKDNTVSVIDMATLTERTKISVGDRPMGMAITPEGDKAYVANQLSNTVSLIDLKSNRVLENIPTDSAPSRILIGGHKEKG